ncbi:MAG: HDOD domain-containing protein [Candidatus Hydrogenedentes bacterium]|nr:HDOD domain-containing protein [Candidatus Hydrogenedentota bacterium]
MSTTPGEKITCACGQVMRVPEGAAGKSLKCVRCGARIDVPEANPLVTAEAAGMGASDTQQVGALLVQSGLVTTDQLAEALRWQEREGGKIIEILIGSGVLDKEKLHQVLSKQSGVPTINLASYQLDNQLLALIPREVALREKVLPIDRLGKLLTVAMACPLDHVTIAEVERITGLKVKAMLCRWDEIRKAVEKHYRPEADTGELVTVTFEHLLGPETRTEDLRGLVPQVKGLTVPDTSVAALAALPVDEAEAIRACLKILHGDPALAMMCLRLANSPVYAMAGDVDSLSLALAAVGVEGVRKLAGTFAAGGMPPRLDQEAVARRAARAGQVAAAVAAASGQVGRATARSAAVLLEVGCIALAELRPEKYAKIDRRLWGPAREEAERRIFTIGHSDASALLAKAWDLPRVLQEGLQYYLRPDQAVEARHLASVLNIAAYAAVAGDAPPAEALAPCERSLALLGLKAGDVLPAMLAVEG